MGGADTETAMYFGLNTAAAFFFSWLIAQELDPDRKLGGIIGGGLSIVAALTLGEGNVLVLLWLLFILRMLNRTSGSRHKIGDNVFLIFIAYWLGKDGYWLYPVLTGTAYIIESQDQGRILQEPVFRRFGVCCYSNAGHFYESAQSFDDLCLSVAHLFYFVLPEIKNGGSNRSQR